MSHHANRFAVSSVPRSTHNAPSTSPNERSASACSASEENVNDARSTLNSTVNDRRPCTATPIGRAV